MSIATVQRVLRYRFAVSLVKESLLQVGKEEGKWFTMLPCLGPTEDGVADSRAWRRIQPHLLDLTLTRRQQYCSTLEIYVLLRLSIEVPSVRAFTCEYAAGYTLYVSSTTFAWLP